MKSLRKWRNLIAHRDQVGVSCSVRFWSTLLKVGLAVGFDNDSLLGANEVDDKRAIGSCLRNL